MMLKAPRAEPWGSSTPAGFIISTGEGEWPEPSNRGGGEGPRAQRAPEVIYATIGTVRDPQIHIPFGRTGILKLPTAGNAPDYVNGQYLRWWGSGTLLRLPWGNRPPPGPRSFAAHTLHPL